MSKKYYVCVYTGASDRIDDVYKNEVKRLGNIIVDNGFSLVYGAGSTGCMGKVAEGVKEKEGYVMGITPHFMKGFEDIFECDNTVMVDTMSERKTLMEKHADIFVIAPGGIGTMDEFFQILTLKYLQQLHAPILILNMNGYYDILIEFINHIIDEKFAMPKIATLFDVIESADDPKFLDYMKKIKSE